MMQVGSNWTINYKIHLNCLNPSHDIGIALQLSNKQTRTNKANYNYENYAPFFGANSYL